nr:MAG TPA: hypothetical protein [Crassvirales sp.]
MRSWQTQCSAFNQTKDWSKWKEISACSFLFIKSSISFSTLFRSYF